MPTLPPGAISYELCGEELWLLPQRAMYWPGRTTLILADAHFGKDATFQAHHIPIPQETTIHGLQRLSSIVDLLSPARLIILGDLLHARIGTTPEVARQIQDWRHQHAALTIHWIRGNHDHELPDLDPPMTNHRRTFIDEPFVFRHHPGNSDAGYVLAGHLHPGLVLMLQNERLRLPCFNFREEWGVLPAFSLFTGLYELPRHKGRHAVISGDEVLLLP